MVLDEVRWGILGCGDVTERKSGPAFNKVPHSRLLAVMRRDAAKAEDYAQRHGVPHWFADADELINSPEINAVYIATPPGMHCELALRVAAAGKPCYVEKPMARNARECQLMVETFEKAGIPLFVAYYRRALPHFEWVRETIRNGSLGKLRELHYRFFNGIQRDPAVLSEWRFQPENSGGGLFWDLGSHALDLFGHWVGPLQEIQGHLWNRSGRGAVEEGAVMRFQAGEVAGQAEWDFISEEKRDEIQMIFERGSLQCSCFGPPTVRVKDSAGKEDEKHFQIPEHIQWPLIEKMVAALRGGPPAPSTGQTAMRTNEVIDRVAAGGVLRNIPGTGK